MSSGAATPTLASFLLTTPTSLVSAGATLLAGLMELDLEGSGCVFLSTAEDESRFLENNHPDRNKKNRNAPKRPKVEGKKSIKKSQCDIVVVVVVVYRF